MISLGERTEIPAFSNRSSLRRFMYTYYYITEVLTSSFSCVSIPFAVSLYLSNWSIVLGRLASLDTTLLCLAPIEPRRIFYCTLTQKSTYLLLVLVESLIPAVDVTFLWPRKRRPRHLYLKARLHSGYQINSRLY